MNTFGHTASRLPDASISQSSTAAVLHDLVRRLVRTGYKDFHAAFDPRFLNYAAKLKHRAYAAPALGPVLDLFLFGGAVPVSALPPEIQQTIGPLAEVGLMRIVDAEHVHLPGLSLFPLAGPWLFCQQPGVNPTMYLGDDSIALMGRASPMPGKAVLDLCAGTGAQSLAWAPFCGHVTAVDINPVACEIAKLNMLMNGMDDRVTVLRGDLYGPVAGQRFDIVVANPPLLPVPRGIRYPFVGDGGEDGMEIAMTILDGLPAALEADGTAYLIGCGFTDGIEPCWLDDVAKWANQAKMDVEVTVLAQERCSAQNGFFTRLVETSAIVSEMTVQSATAAFEELAIRLGGTHIGAHFMRVQRGNGHIVVGDYSPNTNPGVWYVPA